jgi:superfamily I DNA and/or RNA helicase
MPYVVFGPPGTGKTKTVVEAIAQAVTVFPKTFRILACAPSNTAADVLCLGLADHIPPSRMIRVVAASRYKDQVHKDIHPFCLATDDESEAHFKMPEHIAQLADKRVTVTTLSMASKLPFMLDLPRGFFDLIVIDEAGQAPEPEAVAVIAHLLDPTDGQIVLAGDPKQLGPIIHSNLGKRLGLDMSLLERLTNRTVYRKSSNGGGGGGGSGGDDGDAAEAAGVGASAGTYNSLVLTKLVRNYRSHVDILELPSRLFYDGELIAAADKDYTSSLAQWEDLPAKGVPLIFHGVEGKDTREANSPSWFNVAEIEVVRDYVKLLLSTRRNPVKASEIGIIAPYQKQVRKIKALLGNRAMIDVPGKDLGEIMVGSAEQFQGQEKRVIILSTVRSSQEFLEFDARHSLGFLTNAKRFNVAITRPMCLLIVIGHPGVLSGCPNWRALIDHCHRKGACRGVLPPPSQMGAVGAGAVGASAARSELDESLVRMQRRPEVDEDDDGSDHAPSQHIMQTSIGFVREE